MLTTTSPSLDLNAAAEPAAVGLLRRQVRRWLTEVVEDPDVADDLVLAVSEAVENVVDHAFADTDRAGTISVHAHHDGRQVVITVSDDGHWQSFTPEDGARFRGRGLSMIDQLAQSSTVSTGPDGTTVTLVHSC